MRHKLTALMALLTLAVAGAIAPTADADELSATYGATLDSDGTFSEFVVVKNVSADTCKPIETFKPTYDEKTKNCIIGYTKRPKDVTKWESLKLTALGNNKYFFKFQPGYFQAIKLSVQKLYSNYSLNFTTINLIIPKGTTFLSGLEQATHVDNDNVWYKWNADNPYIYVKGTTILDASVAQYIPKGNNPYTGETSKPFPSTESSDSTANSKSPTPAATTNAIALDAKSKPNTSLYIATAISVSIIAAATIIAIALMNKKRQVVVQHFLNSHPRPFLPAELDSPSAAYLDSHQPHAMPQGARANQSLSASSPMRNQTPSATSGLGYQTLSAPSSPRASTPSESRQQQPYQPGQGQPPYGSGPNYPQA